METMTKRKPGRPKKEQASQEAAPIAEAITKEDAIAMLNTEEVVEVEDDMAIETRGRMSDEERSDTDRQKVEMKLIGGLLLKHFREAIKNKELDFNQELQLFKSISPYLGYTKDGNKIAEDIGMDSFAMRYLEVNARIKTAAGRQSAKG